MVDQDLYGFACWPLSAYKYEKIASASEENLPTMIDLSDAEHDRCLYAITLFQNANKKDQVLVSGGTMTKSRRVTDTGTVLVYDIRTDNWSNVAPMLQPRIRHSSCASEKIYAVFGGQNSTIGFIKTIEIYDFHQKAKTFQEIESETFTARMYMLAFPIGP